jgi:hypothetical protein
MPENDEKNEDGLYRADTVPPPDGGGDAYNAPTKVGPMAATVIKEMIAAAQEAAERVEREGGEADAGSSGIVSRDDVVRTTRQGSKAPEDFYDATGDEDELTALSPFATPPTIPPPPGLPSELDRSTKGNTALLMRPAASPSIGMIPVPSSAAPTALPVESQPSQPPRTQPPRSSARADVSPPKPRRGLPLVVVASAGAAVALMALAYGVMYALGAFK